MAELLRFENVTHRYEGSDGGLSDCSVAFGTGEKVAVLGNNGAGKSTFFLLLNGVLAPQSGTIYLDGEPLGRSRRELNLLRRTVGLVFQDPDVQIIGGTVEKEISFGPMNLRLPEGEVRERVDRAIERLDLEKYRERAPQYLSGGEKKRVSIADTLAMEPRMMLLDEPAASLDPANSRLLEANLRKLEDQGMTLVVTTHDVNFAWAWADRCLVFHAGRAVADTTPEKLFADTELLSRCNLEQPLLYQAGAIMGMNPLPRNIAEFAELSRNLKRS